MKFKLVPLDVQSMSEKSKVWMTILVLTLFYGFKPAHAQIDGNNEDKAKAEKQYQDCLNENSQSGKLNQKTFLTCKKYVRIVKPGVGLTSNEILAVIKFNFQKISKCYEETLKKSPDLHGKLNSRIIIAPSGQVKTFKASTAPGDITHSELLSCVSKTIKSWQFPKPRGNKDVTVNYPFVFNPLGGL